MTLVLTELSQFGVAMAADSAVTYLDRQTGNRYARPSAATKLQKVSHLGVGVSCWGMGTIAGVKTDEWLSQFIETSVGQRTLSGFAEELARQLNTSVGENTTGDGRLGFHVAGFEEFNGAPTPSFFHVHDGPSSVLQSRGVTVNPNKFNANHDVTPLVFRELAKQGMFWITRNGDYQLYAAIFGQLEEFFRNLLPLGIVIPHSQDLRDRADYLVFQVRTISEIYRLSNLLPGIGGAIHHLTISPEGIHSSGIRYY